jgi:FkbM family methyltransferase
MEEAREFGWLAAARACIFMIASKMGRKEFTLTLFGFPFRVRGNPRKLGIDGLIYARREGLEPALKPYFRLERPGSVFLDIGANYGYWSRHVLIDAQRRGIPDVSVIAFEPLPANYDLLVENMRQVPGSDKSVCCEPLAVGEATGTCFMSLSNEDPGSSFASDSGSIQCSVTTIDDFVEEHNIRKVGLIKIDVEGFELRVLRGARNTILRDRPAILCEIIPSHLSRAGASADEVMREMTRLGYSFQPISDADYVFSPQDGEVRNASSRAGSLAIVSLHFSPPQISHMLTFGKMFREASFDVQYVLDEPYLTFADFSAVAPVSSAAQYRRDPGSFGFDTALFYNASLRNAFVAKRMRKRGIEVLYVFHEPVPIKYRLAEGWKELAKLAVAKITSLAMLRQSSAVVVGSGYARRLYERYYAKYNPNVFTIPLILDDEAGPEAGAQGFAGRRFFSFLGMAVKAHDFAGFVEFLKYAIRAGSTIPFTIATRTDLSSFLAADGELARYEQQGKVRIQHGRTLSNDEMNSFFAESFCVWNIYTCSTQSGALARAFMTGTPVLASTAGSFLEFVRPGLNGEIVEGVHRYDAILKAAETIRDNLSVYVEGARQTFLETFYYKANRKTLAEILAKTGKDQLQCASL